MALLVTEEDVRAIMAQPGAMGEAVAEVERSFVEHACGDLSLHPRVHVAYPPGSGLDRSIRILPTIMPGLGAAGLRLYATQKVGDPDRPATCELLVLFDFETMRLRSIIEDYSLHTVRTGAPGGVGVKYLARPDARRVGIIGTGRQARGQLAAVASVRRVTEVRAFGRNPERRADFCREMESLMGCPVISCECPEDAVRDAEIVITATHTTVPVLRGAWLTPGTHVNSIARAELDEEVVTRGRIFPHYTHEILHGVPPFEPFPHLLERGVIRESDLSVQLGDVIVGRALGRRSPEDITVFVSSGMAIWDLAVATWADRKARELGLGQRLWDDAKGRTGEGFMTPIPSIPNE